MRLAARGARDLDDGEQAVNEPFMVAQLRRQAREIHIESVLLGVALTGLVLLMPA